MVRGTRSLPVAAALACVVSLAGGAAGAAAAAPRSIYAFANGCFAARGGAAFSFKATGLGTYMLQDSRGRLVTVGADGTVVRGSAPGPASEWALASAAGGRFTLRSTAGGRWLTAAPGTGALGTAAGTGPDTRFRFTVAHGCLPYPEAEVGASGHPRKGRNRDGTVFGYADPHLHITADMRAGGRMLYGESFDRFGISAALGHDSDVHGRDGGLDVTGNLLRTGLPVGSHDTHGWPTFTGWPRYDTYTHQQTYYVWLQRAWMAGLRLVTAQLVEDQALCEVQLTHAHSCDETATIELEAQRVRAMQDYIDAQSGGPGRGWFRLVFDPREARRVIEQGKLAVLMGVESSNLFGCSQLLGQTPCDRDSVDRGIALYQRLGIRATFIAHWVDNAFAGAALEGGPKGTFISLLQVAQTGLPFSTEPCPEAGQGSSCNNKGLTDLGVYLVRRLMDAHMLIEVDHLSERARLQVLQMAEARHYPLVSSHTHTGGVWTPSDLRRLYALGGFASARPDTAGKLAQAILHFKDDVPAGQFLGVGLGTDTGGLAASPAPDPGGAQNPLRYPFRSYDGKVRFTPERTGSRVFDLNKDGVAQYGLYADLLAYMRQQPGGQAAEALLFRSAEAYLRTWQRAAP